MPGTTISVFPSTIVDVVRLTDGSAILIDARVDDNRADLVIALDGLGQRLQDQHTSPFSPGKTRLGSIVKSKCHALVREEPGKRHGDPVPRLQVEVACCHNGLLALSIAET